jgi:aminopeptidase N
MAQGELNLYVFRVQLVDDVLGLAWTGELHYATALSIVDYLQRETEFLPWRAALRNFEVLDRLLRRTLGYRAFTVS